MDTLSGDQIRAAGIEDWRMLAGGLHARFATRTFSAGLAFVSAVAEAAEIANHHPDLQLTYRWVDVRLISHDVSAVTQRDVELADTISEIALARGVDAQPTEVVQLELALDTADLARTRPFWSALLTGDAEVRPGDDVVDPSGRLPRLWFQGTDAHAVPRQRFHVDLWVPHDVAEARIATALAAGGQVVDDSHAPAFVVLADPEGNRVCVCTWVDS